MVKIVKCKICGEHKKVLNNQQVHFIHCHIRQDVDEQNIYTSKSSQVATGQDNNQEAKPDVTPQNKEETKPESDDKKSQQESSNLSIEEGKKPSETQTENKQEPKKEIQEKDNDDLGLKTKDDEELTLEEIEKKFPYNCFSCGARYNEVGLEECKKDGFKCQNCGTEWESLD